LKFLRDWGADWREAKMKVCVSQTMFNCVQTDTLGRVVRDTDSNGWPQTGRDRAVDLLRRAHAFHIGGDQHLSFVLKYGVERFRDAGYGFCVPSVANKYRRWFNPAKPGSNRRPGQPKYCRTADPVNQSTVVISWTDSATR